MFHLMKATFSEWWIVIVICCRLYFTCMASYAWISKCIQNTGLAQQKIFEYGKCNRRWIFNHCSVDLCIDAIAALNGMDQVNRADVMIC